MLFKNSVRKAPGVRSAVAGAVVVLAGGAAGWAQAQQTLEPVVVTATRVPQPLRTSPVGATVITADEIQNSGVSDANEAIRKLGGVASKTDLNNGREDSLDLRGYGDAAGSNLVVLVDGIRLSENEMVSARLSSIPLDLIERIEIIRGGSSVLWGEGASAGVINVILKKTVGKSSSGRASLAIGSHDFYQTKASGLWAINDALSLDGAVDRRHTEGYRRNGQSGQDVISLGGQWQQDGWLLRARVQHDEQVNRLPGGMTLAQFNADPRQTFSPNDHGYLTETRYAFHVEKAWGPWLAQIDLGQRERESTYDQYGSAKPSQVQQTQVSPRLVGQWSWGSAKMMTTLGHESQRWTFSKIHSFGLETGEQDNSAWFVHQDVALATGTRLSFGARQERVNKRGDHPPGGYPPAVSYQRRDNVNASELGINQTLSNGWDVYGRLASSYRLANIDENRLTPLAGPLRPQRNQDREVGIKWAQSGHRATVRAFRQSTKDEIAYDSNLGANANIDPALRQGVEFEGHWQISTKFGVTAMLQELSAKYRSGPYQGKQMVLVSPRTASLRGSYQFNDQHSLNVGIQYLGSMFTQDNPSNQCGRKIPESALLDARYAWEDKGWTVALSGTNLTDQTGYNYDYSCVGGFLYPFAGRELRLTVSRQF